MTVNRWLSGAILAALTACLVYWWIVVPPAQAGAMVATWYGPGFDGNKTASGETFNSGALTAAHPTLPMGTKLEVCYDGCTVVRVNDRGPYSGADIDLSRRAADEIGLTSAGKAPVTVAETGETGPVGHLPSTGGVGQ